MNFKALGLITLILYIFFLSYIASLSTADVESQQPLTQERYTSPPCSEDVQNRSFNFDSRLKYLLQQKYLYIVEIVPIFFVICVSTQSPEQRLATISFFLLLSVVCYLLIPFLFQIFLPNGQINKYEKDISRISGVLTIYPWLFMSTLFTFEYSLLTLWTFGIYVLSWSYLIIMGLYTFYIILFTHEATLSTRVYFIKLLLYSILMGCGIVFGFMFDGLCSMIYRTYPKID